LPRARKPNSAATAALCRFDHRRTEHHPDLATEQVEQYCHAFFVLHALEQAERGGECAIQDADLIARQEALSLLQTNVTVFVFATPHLSDDARRNRGGSTAAPDEMRTADGRLQRAPALRRHIDRNEQVARKKRGADHVDAPGVSPPLEIA